jgi:hypothetical protein
MSQATPCSSNVTVNSRTARHEIPRLMWNLMAHYRSNSPPLAPILSQMNPIPKKILITSHNEGDAKTNTWQLCSKTAIHTTDAPY